MVALSRRSRTWLARFALGIACALSVPVLARERMPATDPVPGPADTFLLQQLGLADC